MDKLKPEYESKNQIKATLKLARSRYLRSNYHATIDSLGKALKANSYLGLYEKSFRTAYMSGLRLCNFLNIKEEKPNTPRGRDTQPRSPKAKAKATAKGNLAIGELQQTNS